MARTLISSLGVLERVETDGLTLIAWEEVLLDWNIKLVKSTLIQV